MRIPRISRGIAADGLRWGTGEPSVSRSGGTGKRWGWLPLIFLVAVSLMTGGCAEKTPKTKIASIAGMKLARAEYASRSENAKLKSYTWYETPDVEEAWRAPMREAIATTLKSKGMTESAENADCSIAFHYVESDGDVVRYLNSFKGYPLGQVLGTKNKEVKDFAMNYRSGIGKAGTVIVDVVSPQEKRIYWRGIGRAADAEAAAREAGAILRRFPGGSAR